ncbi:Calcineurin subunit B type 1, partial [Bonamia ostreae]
ISIEDLKSIPKLEKNVLLERVLQIMTSTENFNFNDFLNIVSVFCKTDNKNEKIEFVFKMYDVNNDGFISNGDLFKSIELMVGNNLSKKEIQELVDRTIFEADQDKDGKISFTEFQSYIKNTNLEKQLMIKLPKMPEN